MINTKIEAIKNVAIIANLDKEGVLELMTQIVEYTSSKGLIVHKWPYRQNLHQENIQEVDFAFVLGGDGTVLYAANLFVGRSTPILPINMGRIGFITEVRRDEWKEIFDLYLAGKAHFSHRLMLKVQLKRNGRLINTFFALNEAVVGAAGISKIVYLDVELGGVTLGEYRADGMLVATPTGSTAYNLAAGGPILHPDVEALILTPICPHSLSNKPLVTSSEEIVTLYLKQKQRTTVMLTVDGRDVIPMEPGDEVVIQRLRKKARFLRSDLRSFYEVVRTKLN